jgi:hypothetical protein
MHAHLKLLLLLLLVLRCAAGRPSRPHSIESLVSRVQAGDLDAAGFVETVAAGRAGPLLRPAASLY